MTGVRLILKRWFNGSGWSLIYQARAVIPAGRVRITGCSWKRCSGWPARARRGAICQLFLATGTASSCAFRAGRRTGSGTGFLPAMADAPDLEYVMIEFHHRPYASTCSEQKKIKLVRSDARAVE